MTLAPAHARKRKLSPVLEFLGVLWELNHRLEVASSEMLRTKGVTAQQRMLIRVIEDGGPLTAGTLAGVMHIHPGTLSTALKRLEQRGLITRERSEDDARRVMIAVTARGARVAADTQGTVEEAVRSALGAGPKSSIRSTKALLRRISEALPVRQE